LILADIVNGYLADIVINPATAFLILELADIAVIYGCEFGRYWI
jgi:hypothetical protein